MKLEKELKSSPQVLKEGPFIINLGCGGDNGKTRTTGRWILGGPEGARQMVDQALQDICDLPEELSWSQLQKAATKIFYSRGLSRIDL